MQDDTPTFDALVSLKSTGFGVLLNFGRVGFVVAGWYPDFDALASAQSTSLVFWFSWCLFWGFGSRLQDQAVIARPIYQLILFYCRTLSSMFLFRFACVRNSAYANICSTKGRIP